MMTTRGYDTSSFVKLYKRDIEYFQNYFQHDQLEKKGTLFQKFLISEAGKTSVRSMLSMTLRKENRICLVFFAEEEAKKPNINKSEISIIAKFIASYPDVFDMNTTIVVVTPLNIGVQALNSLYSLENTGTFKIQVFLDHDLYYNPLNSALGVRYVIMDEEEEQNFMKKIRLLKTQFPKISIHDPVAKYLELSQGQILKTIRPVLLPELLIDEEIQYRVVQNKPLDTKKK